MPRVRHYKTTTVRRGNTTYRTTQSRTFLGPFQTLEEKRAGAIVLAVVVGGVLVVGWPWAIEGLSDAIRIPLAIVSAIVVMCVLAFVLDRRGKVGAPRQAGTGGSLGGVAPREVTRPPGRFATRAEAYAALASLRAVTRRLPVQGDDELRRTEEALSTVADVILSLPIVEPSQAAGTNSFRKAHGLPPIEEPRTR